LSAHCRGLQQASEDFFEAEDVVTDKKGKDSPLNELMNLAEKEGVRFRARETWTTAQVLRLTRRVQYRITGRTRTLVGGHLAQALAVAIKAFLLQGLSLHLLRPYLEDRPDTLFLASWALAFVLSSGIVWVARLLSQFMLEAGGRGETTLAVDKTPLSAFSKSARFALIGVGGACFLATLAAVFYFDLYGGPGSAAQRATLAGAIALDALFLAIVVLLEPLRAAMWRWEYKNGEKERLADLDAARGRCLEWLESVHEAGEASTRAFYAQRQMVALARGLAELESLRSQRGPVAAMRTWRARQRILAMISPRTDVRSWRNK
jgi:hypothetical protein